MYSTPSLSLSLALSVLFLSWSLSRYLTRRRFDVRYLPGPSTKAASWIWGHELEVFQHEATESYGKWQAIFGPMFKIKGALFHPDIIVAADHAAVQHIFADTTNYVKSPQFRPPIANLIGKGLVWAEGDDHAHQRRLLSPAFTAENVKGMAGDVSECAEKLESRLTNLVLSNGGAMTVNMVEYMSMCTLDIIGRVAFGHDFQSGSSTEARAIAGAWCALVNTALSFGAFAGAIVLRALPFISRLPVKMIQAQGEIKLIVGKLAARIIERGGTGTGVGGGRDMLSVLLRAGEKEDGLTHSQIIDNISTLTMVGHETIAGSLNFTLLELAKNPAVQQRLRDEVLRSGRELSYEDVQKLEYLDAVVKEGLRVHPASPQTERVAMRDDVIPLSEPVTAPGGRVLTSLRVQKGQVFHIPFNVMQTRTSVWGADGAEFKPERWLTPGALPPPRDLPHGWSSLVAFCDGPRNCIGYRLAVFEFKVVLATLVRSLEFHDTTAVVQRKIAPTLQAVVDGQGGLLPLHITLAANT